MMKHLFFICFISVLFYTISSSARETYKKPEGDITPNGNYFYCYMILVYGDEASPHQPSTVCENKDKVCYFAGTGANAKLAYCKDND